MAGSLKNIGLTSLDDLFKTDEQRQEDAQERVQIVPADQVFPYARQPYSIDRPTQDLAQLMDSIERVGIAEPLIVRPRDGGGYEIIAGHRRDYCAKAIGLETRPVIVREYSDEDADILVVDYNIHRDDLLPSEKAKAYKLRLDAMKRQAGRPSKNSGQLGQNFQGRFSVDILAEQVDESRKQIQRYIRLNNLIPSLLERVDNGTLKFVPAAESISYLTEKEQTLDTRTRGQTRGRNGSSSTNYQQAGRELMMIDEIRMMDTDDAILLIRGEKPVLDKKYDITRHPNFKKSAAGGAKPYVHKPQEAPDYALPDLPYEFHALDDYEFIDMEDSQNEQEE